MEEKKLVPKLRFPGFTEPWEQRKLGEVANIKTGSRNQQDSVTNGQYPFFIRSEKIEKLDTYDFDTEAILVPGDGRIGEIFHYYNGKFALHQRVYKIDDFKGIDAFYLLYLFQYRFKEHALRLNAQGTVPSLRLPMFTEWDLCIPSLQEQGCIGRFLNKIELIITLHQRKLEHLKLKKKSLLQKLFPKEGEVYPELRFPGFTDPWEQCKLGNLGTLKNGMNFSKEAMGKGYPFINLQNIFGSNVIDLTKLEKAEATDSQLKDYNLQKGDVLFVRSSVKLEGVGEAALISEDLKDTTYSGFIIRFRDNYGLDYNFKRFIFTTVLIRNQIMSQATNSANKNISQSVLNNLNLLIPTKDEQSKIGLIFSKLDKCITLHQRKLEHLQLLKKALLQQLFV